jgi:hypothetical protein
MDLKPDKECEKHGDIVLLSEIITNSMYWQEWDISRYPKKFKKRWTTICCVRLFFRKIIERKIGTASPQFFTSVRRIDL